MSTIHAVASSSVRGVASFGDTAGSVPSLRRHAIGASNARRFVTIDGVRLAYDDVGSGPAIVCLHAIGHGASDFARLAKRLQDRHRVLSLDLPGQGWSDPDPEPPSARRYAELLAA